MLLRASYKKSILFSGLMINTWNGTGVLHCLGMIFESISSWTQCSLIASFKRSRDVGLKAGRLRRIARVILGWGAVGI